MVMKTGDRFIMFIYLIVLTGLFTFFIVLPFGFITYNNGIYFVNKLFREYKWYYFLTASILILINIKLILGLFFEANNPRIGITKYTPKGEVNISFEAIKALVHKAVLETSGLKDIKVFIKPGKDNISIKVKALILPELSIHPTVEVVQETVKSYIEAISGISVGEVQIIVMGIAVDTKLRFEQV
jgi:uncharacterized alkaline shock family protein YloU